MQTYRATSVDAPKSTTRQLPHQTHNMNQGTRYTPYTMACPEQTEATKERITRRRLRDYGSDLPPMPDHGQAKLGDDLWFPFQLQTRPRSLEDSEQANKETTKGCHTPRAANCHLRVIVQPITRVLPSERGRTHENSHRTTAAPSFSTPSKPLPMT